MPVVLNGISDIAKIDGAPANGLLGVVDSVAYRTAEINRHLHHCARAFGLAAIPSGETHRADLITSNPEPFVIDAGNDDWGAWVQIFGSADVGCSEHGAYFDPHRITIVNVETANAVYLIQIAAGASGAAALAAGKYSDLVFIPQSVNGRPAPLSIGTERWITGTKLWARNLARGTNTATLSFYLEIHGYEG